MLFSRAQRLQLGQGAVADAAVRDVDHAHQGHGVERILDQAQVGEQVLHLAALVEARAADEPVGDAAADELLFNGAGLRVRAVHDGDVLVLQALVAHQALQLLGDEGGFVFFVVGLVHDDRRAGAVLCPEVLLLALLVERDDGVRGVEDGLRRAVVLLEDDDARFREVVLEVEDVADVGGAPGVDRLVGIADDADVAVARGPLLGQHVLRDVRVLELVDEDVLPARGVLLEESSSLREELRPSSPRMSSKSRASFCSRISW